MVRAKGIVSFYGLENVVVDGAELVFRDCFFGFRVDEVRFVVELLR